ncbi:MAG TPA: hypothetical protein PLN93_06610 [Vicinamibacterales bacterium]|nr:hypothetical protein [Vicinamibacterales bacterium]
MNDHLKNSMRGELDARISETEQVGHDLAASRNLPGVCPSHGSLADAVATQSRAICTLLRCERARLMETLMLRADGGMVVEASASGTNYTGVAGGEVYL